MPHAQQELAARSVQRPLARAPTLLAQPPPLSRLHQLGNYVGIGLTYQVTCGFPFNGFTLQRILLEDGLLNQALVESSFLTVAKNGWISTPFSGSGTFDIGHWLRLSVMEPKDTPAKTPRAIVLIHALAYLGIALWLAIFLMAALGSFTSNKWFIMALAIGLGLLHFAISRLTAKRSRAAIALTWVLLVADLGLMFFVTWSAAILVIASVVLLLATIRVMRSVPDTP